MDLKAIGEKVRTLRKAKGLTQEDLAANANVAHRALQRLEGGSGNPTIESLHAIAEALSASLADVLAPATQVQPSQSDLSKGEARILELLERQESSRREAAAEIERLKAELAEADKIINATGSIALAWGSAERKAQVLAEYFLTGDPNVLKGLSSVLLDRSKALYRALDLPRPPKLHSVKR